MHTQKMSMQSHENTLLASVGQRHMQRAVNGTGDMGGGQNFPTSKVLAITQRHFKNGKDHYSFRVSASLLP